MSSIWLESLDRNFEGALGLLEAAIRDCTDELWETSMWVVPAWDADAELAGPRRNACHRPVRHWAAAWLAGTVWSIGVGRSDGKETHASTSDPEARVAHKANNSPSRLFGTRDTC